MNKQVKSPFKKAGQGGNKRFLINAVILAAGVAQVVVLVLFAALAAFQVVLYFKLK